MNLRVILLSICFILIAGFKTKASMFEEVKKHPVAERRYQASLIYQSKVKNLDSVYAFILLDQLRSIGKELKDPVLECLYHELKADYYCVHLRENPYSLIHYQAALKTAETANLLGYKALYTFKKGDYHFTFQHYTTAYRYFLEAFTLFEETGYENIPDIEYHFRTISSFFYALGDLESTEYYLLEGMKLKDPDRVIRVDMLNTLGMIHRNKGEYKDALKYFALARDSADAIGHKDWPYITRGNIGSVYMMMGDLEKALPYLRQDYEGSIKNGDSVNAGPAMQWMASISMKNGNIPLALRQLDTLEITLKKSNVLAQWIKFYLLKSTLYEKIGVIDKALLFRKKYDAARDSLNKKNNLLALERVKMRWEAENYFSNISELESLATAERIKRNSVVIVLILLMLFSILFFNKQKLMRKRDRELFENQQALLKSENTRKENELKNAKESMLFYTENIRHKNDMIDLFRKEMAKLQSVIDSSEDQEAKQAAFDKLLHSSLMTNESWDEFKNIFGKLYPDFFTTLKQKFANLNETDFRLCSLIKLKLSNREMAGMLGITIDGIKKAKQRLRKKMDASESSGIEELVESL